MLLAQADLGQSFQDVLSQVLGFIPRFLAFLAILLIGWFVAKAIAKIVDRVLERAGFDRVVERGGVGRAMEATSYDASTLLSRIVFYALLLFVLQLAFGVFGPNPVSEMLFGVLAFLPRLFVAILIVVVAAAIAAAVRDLVRGALGELAYGRVVASLAGGTVLVIGVFAALDQLRVAPAIVTGLFYALLAIVAGSAIVAVGGGGIRPMRRQWEKAIARAEREAPMIRLETRAAAYEDLTRDELEGLARDRDLRGRSEMDKAQLVAALRQDDRTRELRRREPAEPPLSTTTSYHELTRDQLEGLARQRDIEGRSTMSKEELIEALRHDDRTHELRRREPVEPTDATDYEELTVDDLHEIARDRELEGRSSMTKDELVRALRHDDRTTQEVRYRR